MSDSQAEPSQDESSNEPSTSEASDSSMSEEESLAQCKKLCKKYRPKSKCKKRECLKRMSGQQESQNDGESSAESGTSEQSVGDSSVSECSKPAKECKKQKKKKRKSSRTKSSEESTTTDADTTSTTTSHEKMSEATTSASTPVEDESSDSRASTKIVVGSGDTTTTADEDSGWSISEDATLRGMKGDDRKPTWAEIAKVLQRGKKEVQARWKVIKDQAHEPDTDNKEDSGGNEEDEEPESQTKKGKKAAKKATSKDKKSELKWHKGDHDPRLAAENKAAKSRAATKTTDKPILSGEEPSPDASENDDPDDLTYGPSSERRRQARYLHRHIYSDLYPPSINPVPDEYFGPSDCQVLAAVDSKYKRSKWLEMQANFYNVTGRMVPLDVIRDKCERAEAESQRWEQRNSRGGEGSERDRVQSWVSGVDQENLDDPES